MRVHPLAAQGARVLAIVLIAFVAYVFLGFWASAPLGAIYGWSGHPPIPAAPKVVYALLYLAALPALCLAGAWALVRWVERRFLGPRPSRPSG